MNTLPSNPKRPIAANEKDRTRHANRRMQRRGIPPLVERWLEEYGEELYDGHGGIRRVFSRRSIRAMQRDFGRRPVARMAEFFDAFKVQSTGDGRTLTVGHQTRRFRRR